MRSQSIHQIPLARFGLGVCVVLVVFGGGDASGQEKCKMSWEIAPTNVKYTRQHAFDVGDVPGHQIRIFEIHRTFPDDRPNCEGLRRVEQWVRGHSDYIDLNGPVFGYTVTLLENGDRIFAEFSGVSQTVVNPDGSRKSEATTVYKWTGGTGKYQAVRGVQRELTVFDLGKNFNETRAEAEYWFEE
jgi:hypothetical protein